MADIVKYVANAKGKQAGHVARKKDNRWTIRNTQWQIKGVRKISLKTKTSLERSHSGTTSGGTMWTRTEKDRENWRTLAEGYFLMWTDTT